MASASSCRILSPPLVLDERTRLPVVDYLFAYVFSLLPGCSDDKIDNRWAECPCSRWIRTLGAEGSWLEGRRIRCPIEVSLREKRSPWSSFRVVDLDRGMYTRARRLSRPCGNSSQGQLIFNFWSLGCLHLYSEKGSEKRSSGFVLISLFRLEHPVRPWAGALVWFPEPLGAL